MLRGERIESSRGGKEVHATDVARAVDLLLRVDAERIAGNAFNCCDMYIAEEQVAEVAKELTGSASTIVHLNRGPKHQIDTTKLRGLGMTFGGVAAPPTDGKGIGRCSHHGPVLFVTFARLVWPRQP